MNILLVFSDDENDLEMKSGKRKLNNVLEDKSSKKCKKDGEETERVSGWNHYVNEWKWQKKNFQALWPDVAFNFFFSELDNIYF